jgi:hypothetical protein
MSVTREKVKKRNGNVRKNGGWGGVRWVYFFIFSFLLYFSYTRYYKRGEVIMLG